MALVHAIGRLGGPAGTNPWLKRYIFPGGYSPALSEVLPAVERSGLLVTDIEILRLHYAETIRHWRRRFADAAGRRRRLCTTSGSAGCSSSTWPAARLAFRRQDHMVWQMQLAGSHSAVPITRDYMAAAD